MNYIEDLLILASAVTGCVSISAFGSLLDIPIGITSSAVWLKVCAITTGIKQSKTVLFYCLKCREKRVGKKH